MRSSILAVAVAWMLATSACSGSTPGPTGTTAAEAEATAADLVAQLAQQVSTARIGVTFTAETDPNHLLGRPGGYTSRTTFIDTRAPAVKPVEYDGQTEDDRLKAATRVDHGGTVEVYADEKGAAARKAYLEAFVQGSAGLFTEYDYQAGKALSRVSGKLTPAQAAEYQAAIDSVTG